LVTVFIYHNKQREYTKNYYYSQINKNSSKIRFQSYEPLAEPRGINSGKFNFLQ